MLESEAWQSLSLAARRVLDCVMLEHMAHAGAENGNLVVTYTNFEVFGVRRNSIKTAIEQATACGLLIITQKGRPSAGQDRWPTRYALGWLPMSDGAAARNRWKAWRKPRAKAPIGQDIDSSNGSDTRENRRNPGPPVTETPPAPSSESATCETAEIGNCPVAEARPGEKTSARDGMPGLPKFLDRRRSLADTAA
jgi:hypothetical protein